MLDLHSAEDLKKFRKLSNEVSALVRQFKGSLAGEHGVGIARTEYLRDHLGESCSARWRRSRTPLTRKTFSIRARFSTTTLQDRRQTSDQAGSPIALPFTPILAFAARDESFIGNLEQCNGCGGCRKDAPTMCPTFLATGEEIMSTRGRANTIRAALEQRGTEQRSARLSKNWTRP